MIRCDGDRILIWFTLNASPGYRIEIDLDIFLFLAKASTSWDELSTGIHAEGIIRDLTIDDCHQLGIPVFKMKAANV